MNNINQAYLRQIHRKLVPFMLFPLLLTILTGTLFQVAVITENADNFSWLLALHRGKFGRINLENIYPFLNGFGLLTLLTTGIMMWLQTHPQTK